MPIKSSHQLTVVSYAQLTRSRRTKSKSQTFALCAADAMLA